MTPLRLRPRFLEGRPSGSASFSTVHHLRLRGVGGGAGGGVERRNKNKSWSGPSASTSGVNHSFAEREEERERRKRGADDDGGREEEEDCVLKVVDLTYRPASASRALLNGVSFKLLRGRIGLIYGPSGSGKSTLLNVLAGFANDFDGDVWKKKEGGEAQGEGKGGGIGVVFQFPERYFVGNTIIEELSFGWRHSNKLEVRSEFVSRLQSVLKVTGLEYMPLDRKLSELSGGYQRRVAIAVQLLRKPSVLLLDEPTAGMDLPSISALCETLELVKETSAVLVVSHDTEMLSQIADDVWQMKSGGILVAQD